MKANLPARLTLVLCVAFTLSACAIGRHVPFNEADFAPYRGPGTGSVTGQLAVTMSGGEREVGKESDVELLPINPYTEEMVDIQLVRGSFISPHSDPRIKKYARVVTATEDGHFAFHQVPAGRYFVFGEVSRYDAEFDDWELQWGLERISVANGQTVNIAVSHNPLRSGVALGIRVLQ